MYRQKQLLIMRNNNNLRPLDVQRNNLAYKFNYLLSHVNMASPYRPTYIGMTTTGPINDLTSYTYSGYIK